MNVQLQNLVFLQETDEEISELEKSLKLIPGQIAAEEKELEGKKGKLHAVQEEIESLKKKRQQLEQDVKVENDHMVKTKSKLPTVKTNKEYTALLSEIETHKNRITQLEDQELEIMERQEDKETEIPGLREEFGREEARFLEYKKQKETERDRMQQELEAMRKKRAELVAALDPKLVRHYDNVVKLRGDRAVVPLKNEICQGCYQAIRPQVAIEVKVSDKIHQCQYCDRFLYWIPEPETENQEETAVPK